MAATRIRNDGARHFTAFPERIAAGHGSWHIAVGDLNGDAFPDAAFNNAANNTIAIVYGSPNGPRAGPAVSVPSQPERVIIADRHLVVINGNRDEVLIVPVP